MIKKATDFLPNVKVDSYDGLLVDYVRRAGAAAIVKGLRALSDFEYEFQMALTNKKLLPYAETVFLTTSAENMYLSSSLVKQVAGFGGDITDFVPSCVLKTITGACGRDHAAGPDEGAGDPQRGAGLFGECAASDRGEPRAIPQRRQGHPAGAAQRHPQIGMRCPLRAIEKI